MDREKLKGFAVHLMGVYGGGALVQMIDLGARTGLTDALAAGPGTSEELAGRSGLVERYVREWLHGMTAGGIVEHDPDTDVFTLPPEHAACLTGDHFYNTSAIARVLANGNRNNEQLARAFRDGGGIAYDEQPSEVLGLMDAMGRARYDTFLVSRILTVDDVLHGALEAGARVCDVGCGTGHVANLIAEAFPASEVTGIDRNEAAVALARQEAAERGLANVSFAVEDAAELPHEGFDVVTAFDVIHDLPHPTETLAAVHAALRPGGTFLMYDGSAPTGIDAQRELPWATMMYGVSLNACIANAMSSGDETEALGPMWAREDAEAALRGAGFDVASVHPVPGDPMNALYVARR